MRYTWTARPARSADGEAYTAYGIRWQGGESTCSPRFVQLLGLRQCPSGRSSPWRFVRSDA